MTTSWGDEDFIWVNAFAFLDVTDVGRCTTVSSLVNKCAQQHFQQVPTTVQIVQHTLWDTPTAKYADGPIWAPPFDGDQGVVYLNRERPFAQLYSMIVSALDLSLKDSVAVKVIYHGLLVQQTWGCNPPTFSKSAEGTDERPHVDVAINFAYLEWNYINQQIPIDDWILDLKDTQEALLFAQGTLCYLYDPHVLQRGADGPLHYWHHREWNCSTLEWTWDDHGSRPDKRSMLSYIALRVLEADLRIEARQKYGVSTHLPGGCHPIQEDQVTQTMEFHSTDLYDFNGQRTHPGANLDQRHLSTWGCSLPQFPRYFRWWDLPFPCVKKDA